MLKDVGRYKIQNGLNNKEKVFVKHFSVATVEDMKNYAIPSRKHENDLVTLHNLFPQVLTMVLIKKTLMMSLEGTQIILVF